MSEVLFITESWKKNWQADEIKEFEMDYVDELTSGRTPLVKKGSEKNFKRQTKRIWTILASGLGRGDGKA